MTEARRRRLRIQAASFAVVALVAAGSWLMFLWLESLPFIAVIHVINGHTSTWWSAMCLIIAAAASVLAAGLLLTMWLGAIRTLPARIAVGGMGLFAGAAGAFYLLILCMFGLAAAGVEGTQTLVSAQDGTTVMITQDGFDGDVVNFYDPVQGGEWVRRPETGSLDPRDGPCTLEILNAATLTFICGPHSQELARH